MKFHALGNAERTTVIFPTIPDHDEVGVSRDAIGSGFCGRVSLRGYVVVTSPLINPSEDIAGCEIAVLLSAAAQEIPAGIGFRGPCIAGCPYLSVRERNIESVTAWIGG